MSTPHLLHLLAHSHAEAWLVYDTDFCELVDILQEFAEQTGLVAQIGQDAVQEIIAAPFAIVREMIDAEEATLQPEPEPELEPPLREYRTPQATIEAFWHVVRLGNEKHLAEWLAAHPVDAPHLHQLWREKCSTQAA